MTANPLSTMEEVRNEFADIRRDAAIYLVECLVAENNGHDRPATAVAALQGLAERVFAARVADANLSNEDAPDRPDYLDAV